MVKKRTFFLNKYVIWRPDANFQVPNVDFVPSLIRRRLTKVEKIGIFLAEQFSPIKKNTKIVFASQYGEWQQTIKLIHQMHDENEMSPAGFSHSVHNAMPGLYTMYKKITNNYTTVAANEATLDNALIESFATKKDVLLIYAEEDVPDFYKPAFHKKISNIGIAILFSHTKNKNSKTINVTFQKSNKTIISPEDLIAFLEKSQKLTSQFFTMDK